MEKIYDLHTFGRTHKIELMKGNYQSNGTLAIRMVEVFDDGHKESWSILTVNIQDSDWVANSVNLAFVDTNNNGSDIIHWLEENDIAYSVGIEGRSGWCSYPLVRFTENALKNMSNW